MRSLRAKRKQQDPEFSLNESKRVEALRKKRVQQMSKRDLAAYRRAAAARKQKSREKKQKAKLSGSAKEAKKAYKSPQGLGRATKKTEQLLPKSPRKRREVISHLAKKAGIQVLHDSSSSCTSSASTRSLSAETEKVVKDFFMHMDIAYTAPGMKDEVTVWEKGIKTKKRKFYLTMYLKEAYAIYSERFPVYPISFSAFAKLRPLNVLLMKDTPADQCKCMQHENFTLGLAGLGINYGNDWLQNILCDAENLHGQCWKGECADCGIHRMRENLEETDKAKEASWMSWEKQDNGRLMKIVKSGCFGELQELVMAMMPEFQEHVRVKRIQALSFEEKKKENKVIQMDFAMSYSCEYQNEIQSALWSRDSVTLFTAAIFSGGRCETHLIVSNTSDKGKDSVYTFAKYLAAKAPNDPIIFFTDGPSSEFKNKFIAKLLLILAQEYGKMFEWQYFATSHGKGVVDGVGGAAKSLVRQAIRKNRATAESTSAEIQHAVAHYLKGAGDRDGGRSQRRARANQVEP
ncbi:hypothetical protein HOLleu_15805 [Holothuria leucospilota]|uniref:Uncharacterized protein n=1 Tax=Holothuria leucospilota TaxID=206669 RepID=A0A9Q1C4A6_HOLLE|nr:hypothetical protein HOLleu_15805 [Holothuria leucospilota]